MATPIKAVPILTGEIADTITPHIPSSIPLRVNAGFEAVSY